MITKIRRATAADATEVCQVLHRSITESCREDHRNDADVLSLWLANKTPDKVSAWLSNPASYSVVATSDNNIVGISLLTEEGELALFYILPEVRFTGAGKSLLKTTEYQAFQMGLTEIFLSSASTAKSFYSRNGYSPNGVPVTEDGVTAYPLIKQLDPAK